RGQGSRPGPAPRAPAARAGDRSHAAPGPAPGHGRRGPRRARLRPGRRRRVAGGGNARRAAAVHGDRPRLPPVEHRAPGHARRSPQPRAVGARVEPDGVPGTSPGRAGAPPPSPARRPVMSLVAAGAAGALFLVAVLTAPRPGVAALGAVGLALAGAGILARWPHLRRAPAAPLAGAL